MEKFKRTKQLIGDDAVKKLIKSNVLIIGLGGVGSYATEAIARAGIGHITVMDGDDIAESNINRQIIAYENNIGKSKAEAASERIKSINSDAEVLIKKSFYHKDCDLDLNAYDYVIDAIDSVEDKLDLIEACLSGGINIISSMGTAGKIRNDSFKIADISETSVCPLAKKIRKELRARNIYHLKVVYSTEKANVKAGILGSISYVPPVAGLMMAGEVIRELGGI